MRRGCFDFNALLATVKPPEIAKVRPYFLDESESGFTPQLMMEGAGLNRGSPAVGGWVKEEPEVAKAGKWNLPHSFTNYHQKMLKRRKVNFSSMSFSLISDLLVVQ